MSFQTFDERIALAIGSQLLPADTTVAKSFWTIAGDVRRLDTVVLSSTDTVDRVVQFSVLLGATNFPLFEVNVPAGAGHGVVPAVELFATINQVNLVGIVIPTNGTLQWSAVVTVTAAKAITAVALGGIF